MMKGVAPRPIQVPPADRWQSGRVGMLRTFSQMPRQTVLHDFQGNTDDIIRVIMIVCEKQGCTEQVRQFSEKFRSGDTETQYAKLGELWAFARKNIRYLADPPGIQDVKHPIATYEDGACDCKSLTVFLYHAVRAIGLPCYIEFASYDGGPVGHVYAVAELAGEPVYLDAVYERFDEIEAPVFTLQKYPKSSRTIAGWQRQGGSCRSLSPCGRYRCLPNYLTI